MPTPFKEQVDRGIHSARTHKLRTFFLAALMVGGLAVLVWALFPGRAPAWTGFGGLTIEGVVLPPKTLWSWLELLAVPAAILTAVIWLYKANQDARQQAANHAEAQRATEIYLARMSELLLEQGLAESAESSQMRQLARAQTAAALRNADPERKGHIVGFLHDAGLLNQADPVVSLRMMNLAGADLSGYTLEGVSLQETQLQKANLRGCQLTTADLRGSALDGAVLEDAQLQGAYLRGANLRGAQLCGADLARTTLTKAIWLALICAVRICRGEFERCRSE